MRLLDEGRALCRPVCYEMFGRPQPPGEQSLARERDRVIHVAKDLSRTVDYLETRSDMDLDKLACLGLVGVKNGDHQQQALASQGRVKFVPQPVPHSNL